MYPYGTAALLAIAKIWKTDFSYTCVYIYMNDYYPAIKISYNLSYTWNLKNK